MYIRLREVSELRQMFNERSIHFGNFSTELIAPTTTKTTEHYENGRKSKDSQMVGDYGVEEWKDGGKWLLIINSFTTWLINLCNAMQFGFDLNLKKLAYANEI